MCGNMPPTPNDCAANYQYLWINHNIWDELNKVVSGVGGDAEKAGALFQSIFDFITKYGMWFLIGLVALICIPLIISLVKSFTSK